jgi:signal peptidase II
MDPREQQSGEASGAADLPVTSPAQQRRFSRAKWIVLVVITLVVGIADQASKRWAQHELQRRPGGRTTVIAGYATFSYVRNPGAAWGFLARAKESFRQPFFVAISVAAMLFILYIHLRLEPGQYLLLVALSLVMGGAVGNFIDRLRYHYVIDFIKLHYREHEWPTFNVADIAITLGVILLFGEMFFGPAFRRRRERARGAAAPTAEGGDGTRGEG